MLIRALRHKSHVLETYRGNSVSFKINLPKFPYSV